MTDVEALTEEDGLGHLQRGANMLDEERRNPIMQADGQFHEYETLAVGGPHEDDTRNYWYPNPDEQEPS